MIGFPCAWYLPHPPINTPHGPGEWEVDVVYGDEAPEGNGWRPLYEHPPAVARLQKALLDMQLAAGTALDALPNDQKDGIVGDFLAAIHRHCASALSEGDGGDFAEVKS